MTCVRIGGLEAFADDIHIPLKYGVDQCVGDTICAGGIMYGQRSIPATLDFCKDIREVAEPGALLPQLRQPDGDEDLGLRSSTAASRPSASATACRTAGARSPAALGIAPHTDLDIICSGINHQTWYIGLKHGGRDVTRDELIAAFERASGLLPAGEGAHRRAEALRLLLDRVERPPLASTCPGTASARTRSSNWIDMSDWIHGETGGYLRYSTENRNWFETDFPKFLEDAGKPLSELRAHRRARQPHHRGAGDRPHLPRPLQRPQQRRHHQPARRLHHREPRLRRPLRHQHDRRRHPARAPAPPPARPRSTCSGWRWRRR